MCAPLRRSSRRFLGLDGTSRYGALTFTPQQRRSRTLAALIDQLAGLAGRKPVLWADRGRALDRSDDLGADRAGARPRAEHAAFSLLITARPTFVAGFASHPVVTRLALNRLARAATQAIVARITRGKRLPDALLDEIAAKNRRRAALRRGDDEGGHRIGRAARDRGRLSSRRSA